jgi:hypothetical protein
MCKELQVKLFSLLKEIAWYKELAFREPFTIRFAFVPLALELLFPCIAARLCDIVLSGGSCR